jgi:hypothetical protein
MTFLVNGFELLRVILYKSQKQPICLFAKKRIFSVGYALRLIVANPIVN